MPKKPIADLLAPRGDDPGADYIRRRLKRRLELERGITLRPRQLEEILRCLDEQATHENILKLHDEVLAETSGPVWGLEMEPLMLEVHGSWRYDGRHWVFAQDIERAARHYAVSHVMDALLKECRFPVVRTREERLDDAAWYCVPERER
jgi:hypothetical protein